MISFYYTGAQTANGSQPEALRSLGGLVSSTKVPSASLDNIFSSISPYSAENKNPETIGLALVNEAGVELKNLKFWFEMDPNISVKIEMALVSLINNSCGLMMERISNRNASPYQADFNEALGEENALILFSLSKDAKIGLWLKRSPKETSTSTNNCDSLYEDFKKGLTSMEKAIKINFKIKWD